MRLDPPDRRDAAVEGIVAGALETDRARLRHAVGDGHFAHMHAVDDPAHDLNRAGRAGHDAGSQRLEVEAVEFGMIEHGDEHGRHAVQPGAGFGLNRFQRCCRIERLGRAHHAGAVGDAGEVAQHHAEAVIIGHRDAQPVVRREPHRLADEIAVVDDVVVRQRRALRRARCAGGELDVDWVVELQRSAEVGERLTLIVAGGTGDVVEIQHAGRLLGPETNDGLEPGQAVRPQLPRFRPVDLGRARPERGEIVVVAVSRREDQRPAAGFLDRIVEFVRAVGGIDVDQDEAGERRAELRQHPFARVGRPDADAVAFLETERHEADGEILRPAQEIGIGPAHPLMTRHERRPARAFVGHAAKQRADRLAQERRRTRAVHIGLRQKGHGVSSRYPWSSTAPTRSADLSTTVYKGVPKDLQDQSCLRLNFGYGDSGRRPNGRNGAGSAPLRAAHVGVQSPLSRH